MTRLNLAAALAFLTAAVSGTACAPVRVHAFTERQANLARYRTYAFAPSDQTTGDARLDGNRFFDERVQAALNKGLGTRGFEQVSTGRADLLVHYHARITQELDVPAVERTDCVNGSISGQSGGPDHCRPYAYESGTLLVDLVDARTKTLVWRGWAEGALEGVLSDQRWMEKRVDDSVARILEKLPRRL